MSHLLSRQEAIESGVTRYFTGQPCKRGHVSERFTSGGACVACEEMKRKQIQERYRAAKEAAGNVR